jgi:hypothetical protein
MRNIFNERMLRDGQTCFGKIAPPVAKSLHYLAGNGSIPLRELNRRFSQNGAGICCNYVSLYKFLV